MGSCNIADNVIKTRSEMSTRWVYQRTCSKASRIETILLPSETKLRRLCFYTWVSVHRVGLEYLGRYPPRPGTPPRTRYTPLPGTRYTPLPGTRYTPCPPPISPNRTRCTPRNQVHPQRRLLLRTVRILLECILGSVFFPFLLSLWWLVKLKISTIFFHISSHVSLFSTQQIR